MSPISVWLSTWLFVPSQFGGPDKSDFVDSGLSPPPRISENDRADIPWGRDSKFIFVLVYLWAPVYSIKNAGAGMPRPLGKK